MRTLSIVCAALLLVGGAVDAWANEECLACHGDAKELKDALSDPNRPIAPLIVDLALHKRSVHADIDCTDCHQEFDYPHSEDSTTMSCTECHDDLGEGFAAGIHNQPGPDGKTPNATCTQCHGHHGILPRDQRDSLLHPLNVHKMCGTCHFESDPRTASVKTLMQEKYADDGHARGILKHGLAVSATCVSCHGGHEIRAKGDPASRLARTQVAQTCGTCHIGVLEAYNTSVHHVKGGGPDQKGATCIDCHTPHDIRVAEQFHSDAARACMRCHEERGSSFRLSYHGKVMSLGDVAFGEKRVATCDACHGHHAIQPEADPRSMVNPANRVETCKQCHENAHEEFAQFQVHADPADADRNPGLHTVYVLMNGLLVGTLILGCLHALLWLIRALAAGEWKRPKIPGRMQRWVRRWPYSYVVFHIWMMTTVLTLAATGLPLHYADQPWAQDFMGFFGGASIAGFIHRVAAVMLVVLFVAFLTQLVRRWLVHKERGLFWGPDSMVPRKKDLADLWGNIRWFLFLAPRPKYDRWTYWEKFDFWAATWGLFVIGLSGLMLWFPEEATHVVPAWFLNAAVIIHGIEALLDIAFIFTVHVFHANLRPDKFPMDTMFLTGRVTEEEFKHERPEEYERAVREGFLEEMLASRPRRRTRAVAYLIGTAALAVGFFFVGAMIVAVLDKLS